MTKSNNEYFKINQLPGTPAQKYLDVARRSGKFFTPLVAIGILLVLQPFWETISDWFVDFGWFALWAAYLLLNIPGFLFYFRRTRELRFGYSTWDKEDRVENKLGERIVLVDADTGLILRVAGQARKVPASQSESRRERIARLAPMAVQVDLSSRASRDWRKGSAASGSPDASSAPKLDDVMQQIQSVD